MPANSNLPPQPSASQAAAQSPHVRTSSNITAIPSMSSAATASRGPKSCQSAWWVVCSEEDDLDPANRRGTRVALLPGTMWTHEENTETGLLDLSPEEVQLCPRFGACQTGGVGGAQTRCTRGHTGGLCAACQAGFGAETSLLGTLSADCRPCQPCSEWALPTWPWALAIFIAVSAAVLTASHCCVSKRGTPAGDLAAGSAFILTSFIFTLAVGTLAGAQRDETLPGVGAAATSATDWAAACGRTPEKVAVLSKGYVPPVDNVTWVSDAGSVPPAGASVYDLDLPLVMRRLPVLLATSLGLLPATSSPVFSCVVSALGAPWVVNSTYVFGSIHLAGALACLALVAMCVNTTLLVTEHGLASPRDYVWSLHLPQGKQERVDEETQYSRPLLRGLLASWTCVRAALNVYLLTWGAVLGSILLLLGPLWSKRGTDVLVALGMTWGPGAVPWLREVLWILFGLHGVVVPLLLATMLGCWAPDMLHKCHHTSATMAALAPGIRVELNPRVAAWLSDAVLEGNAWVPRGLESTPHLQLGRRVASAVARRTAAELRNRSCMLGSCCPAHWLVPSRMLLGSLMMSALWLAQPGALRLRMVLIPLILSAAITALRQPYAVHELNAMDLYAHVVALLHVSAVFSDASPGSLTIVAILELLVLLRLSLALARATCRPVHLSMVGVTAAFSVALESLPQHLAREDALTASDWCDPVDCIRAGFVDRGCQRCGWPLQGMRRAASASATQQWRDLVSQVAAITIQQASRGDDVDPQQLLQAVMRVLDLSLLMPVGPVECLLRRPIVGAKFKADIAESIVEALSSTPPPSRQLSPKARQKHTKHLGLHHTLQQGGRWHDADELPSSSATQAVFIPCDDGGDEFVDGQATQQVKVLSAAAGSPARTQEMEPAHLHHVQLDIPVEDSSARTASTASWEALPGEATLLHFHAEPLADGGSEAHDTSGAFLTPMTKTEVHDGERRRGMWSSMDAKAAPAQALGDGSGWLASSPRGEQQPNSFPEVRTPEPLASMSRQSARTQSSVTQARRGGGPCIRRESQSSTEEQSQVDLPATSSTAREQETQWVAPHQLPSHSPPSLAIPGTREQPAEVASSAAASTQSDSYSGAPQHLESEQSTGTTSRTSLGACESEQRNLHSSTAEGGSCPSQQSAVTGEAEIARVQRPTHKHTHTADPADTASPLGVAAQHISVRDVVEEEDCDSPEEAESLQPTPAATDEWTTPKPGEARVTGPGTPPCVEQRSDDATASTQAITRKTDIGGLAKSEGASTASQPAQGPGRAASDSTSSVQTMASRGQAAKARWKQASLKVSAARAAYLAAAGAGKDCKLPVPRTPAGQREASAAEHVAPSPMLSPGTVARIAAKFMRGGAQKKPCGTIRHSPPRVSLPTPSAAAAATATEERDPN